MITIQNDRLNIQISEPGSSYKRTRFDWSGVCQQITLDGKHTYCSREATTDDLGTEGIGLIDEFGIHTPIGYDQIEIGEWFPKIGVGFLQKVNNSPYEFFSDYILQPVPISVEQDDGQVSFLQESQVLNGWGWRLRKTLTVDESILLIEYALENCGEKSFVTEQYNHNFIAINSQTVGPDYQLQTSFPMNFGLVNGDLQVETNQLTLTKVPVTYVYALQTSCANLDHVNWGLTHVPSGHGLRVREPYPLFKFALWGKSHVISPEFFIWIDLQPGQTETWQRRYDFF